MSIRTYLLSLRRNLFRREEVEQDLDAELRVYLDQLTDEKIAAGMSEAAARREARIEIGGVEQVKEEVRDAKAGRLAGELWQDMRYGMRTLWRNRRFAVAALLALGLGIGATTSMFSVAYGILLRPLPYPDAGRVAVVGLRYYPRDNAFGTLCIRDFLTWRENNHSFEEPSLFQSMRMDVGGGEGAPEQVQGASVTAGFFNTLGVRPLIGRGFGPEEDAPATGSLVVIGEGIWRRRFSANAQVLGQSILVNGAPATVIGVMPAGFEFPRRETEVWTNLVLNPPTRYGPWFYRGVARLKPGVTFEQAQAETNNIGQRMMELNALYKRLSLPVLSLRDAMLGTTIKPAILVLAGAVGFVLLIAVVNVANLMLARAAVREREMALRLGLGAGRRRLVRQLLTESVLLALIGGALGLVLAWSGVEVIRAWNPGNLPFIESVRLDGGALCFTILVSTLTGILFGLAPALASARSDLNAVLKDGGRGASAGRARGGMRAALVISEVAISLMLLVGAGLLFRSFVKLNRADGGFSAPPRQVLTMLISPGNRKYGDAKAGAAFYEEVLRRVRGLPGVETAAVTDSLPPDRQGDADTFVLEGQPLGPGELNPIVSAVTVGPDYFRALGIPVLRGRSFTPHDNPGSPPVAIVSEAFVQRFMANQDPIGKRLQQSGPGFGDNWMQIVGVVGNVKYLGLRVDADPAYYVPFLQSYGPRIFLVVRSSGDAETLSDAVRKEILSIDPGVTLAFISTMEQSLRQSMSQPRFDTLLLALFAGIALLLASVGIYGLIAYAVTQRTHEIGVRMALGASRADILRSIFRQGLTLAAGGIAAGLAGAFALTRLLQTMLFGVAPTDRLTFAVAPLTLLAVVLLASLLPALRATRVSPVAALRYE